MIPIPIAIILIIAAAICVFNACRVMDREPKYYTEDEIYNPNSEL